MFGLVGVLARCPLLPNAHRQKPVSAAVVQAVPQDGVWSLALEAVDQRPHQAAAHVVAREDLVQPLVGAIGVSGAPNGEADDVCARAGIAAIEDDISF